MSYIIRLMHSLFNHYINQLNLSNIQIEAIRDLTNVLFEDAASTATHKTKRVIREVLPKFSSMFDEIATDNNGEPILTSTGKTQTGIEYLERNVKNMYFHDGKSNIKFEPGVARIAYGELGMQGNEDTRKLRILGRILQEISTSHSTEYDANFNWMSYDELNERFGGTIKQADDSERDELKNASYDKSDYIIKWVPDFETAQQYSKYTDYGDGEHWCLTYRQVMWKAYTGHHNENKVYFCYIPEFEHVEHIVGENAPLDEYGLSLLSVIVTPENELRAVTCRWNHTNGGSDGVMDAKQLSTLLGGYVFDVCPPYSKEEVKSRGYVPLEDVQQMLDDGVDLSEYMLGNVIICIRDKYNFVRDGKLLSNKWFDGARDFNDGFARVELNGKCNFIDPNGNFLSDQWFDGAGDFNDGYTPVKLNGKWNFIDTNVNFLSDQWFDDAGGFNDGFARVELNGKWNFVDTNVNFLSDQWFDGAANFNDGVAQVQLDGKYNFIDSNGNFLSDQWFDMVRTFREEGHAVVKLNGKWNYIDINGNLLSDQWFEHVGPFREGLVEVRLDGKSNYIDTNGNFLSEQWFDGVCSFTDGYAPVTLNDKWNYIDINGNLLSDQWFDKIHHFNNGHAKVTLNGKWNYIDINGNLISEQWIDYMSDFYHGHARVQSNGKFNFIDTNFNLSSEQWFDMVGKFSEGHAPVKSNGKCNYIDTNLKLISDQWFDKIGRYHEGYASVELNDKYNFIDTNGNFLSDQWFDYCGAFHDGHARVELNGKWYNIDTNGNLS